MASYIKHLCCPRCGSLYEPHHVQTVCTKPDCKSTLYAEYELPLNTSFGSGFTGHIHSIWKYSSFLPVQDPVNIISLGEGLTPVIKLNNLSIGYTENEIWLKDEAANPTGSFKARGISVAVSKAKELGLSAIAVPTAGNAGGALAAYAARGGLKAHIFMPKETPKIFKDECRLYGAQLTEVEGNIAACGAVCQELSRKYDWFQLSTLKEPYRLEGKKTMGYEIAEQFRGKMPDVILYPTGGGTGLLGIWKAFEEMQILGWLPDCLPRIVAVQSTSCNGIVTAFHKHLCEATSYDGGYTIANGLRVPRSFASNLILDVLRISAGTAVSISDADILSALKQMAAKEGLLIAPEGAALWAAFQRLHKDNWIKAGERVLLLNTGSGYKYMDNLQIDA